MDVQGGPGSTGPDIPPLRIWYCSGLGSVCGKQIWLLQLCGKFLEVSDCPPPHSAQAGHTLWWTVGVLRVELL